MSEAFKASTTRYQKVLNFLSFFLLAPMFLYPVFMWNRVPDMIPSHYGFDGRADDWSPKESMIFLPLLGTLLYTLLTFVSRIPAVWNAPVPITPANEKWVYQNQKSLLVTTKFLIMSIFFYINYQSINCRNTGSLFLFIYTAAIFGSILFFCLRCRKTPK